jgi:hypothetical protein
MPGMRDHAVYTVTFKQQHGVYGDPDEHGTRPWLRDEWRDDHCVVIAPTEAIARAHVEQRYCDWDEKSRRVDAEIVSVVKARIDAFIQEHQW